MTERDQWVWDLIHAEGTQIYPSKLNRGKVVVVDGRTDLDACEPTAERCFDALWEERNGGMSPGRISLVVTRKVS